MKQYLLLILIVFFGINLIAQVATDTSMAATPYNEEEEEEYYESDCDHEEILELTESSDIGLEEKTQNQPLRIYPNPTTEFISITDNSTVAFLYIYNIIGRRVKWFPVFPGGQYSLRDLPDGMYLISMIDADGHVLRTVRTSKSIPRP